MDKRCFNTQEAQQYLGVRRRFFEEQIVPRLPSGGVRAGASVLYERAELDAAWESYKMAAGSERPARRISTWDDQKQTASTRQATARIKSTPATGGSVFESAVAQVMQQRSTS